MTEDMLKCIVQTLDMLLTQASNNSQTMMYINQQDKLREIFKKELKDAPRT